MEVVSLFHSFVYTGLLICAFLLDKPQPITFILGLSHGLLWIGMSITLLGCVAPFFGTVEFLLQSRQRKLADEGAVAS